MALLIARWMLAAVGTYLGLGLLFAVAFLVAGIGRIDPSARGAPWGFRLIVLPGVVALWLLLLKRWASGASQPPEERTAHRTGARGRVR